MVLGVELIPTFGLGRGDMKTQGPILIYYIEVLSEFMANLQYRISKQLDTGVLWQRHSLNEPHNFRPCVHNYCTYKDSR